VRSHPLPFKARQRPVVNDDFLEVELKQRGFKKLKERGIHAASRSKFMEA